MFDVGFVELLIIGLVALLFLGPEKLIKAAQVGGRMLGKWRRQFATMKDEVEREMRVDELRKQLAKEEKALRDSMNDGLNKTMADMASIRPPSFDATPAPAAPVTTTETDKKS